MLVRGFRIHRRVLFPAILAVVAMSSYGFAASNGIPGTRAGDGSAAVSGFTVVNVHYNLDPINPQQLASVTFTIAPAVPAGGTVRISTDGGSTWSASCGTGSTITCASSAAVSSIIGLRVVAAQ